PVGSPRSLGMKLHHLRDRIAGGRFLDSLPNNGTGVRWRVVRTATTATTATTGPQPGKSSHTTPAAATTATTATTGPRSRPFTRTTRGPPAAPDKGPARSFAARRAASSSSSSSSSDPKTSAFAEYLRNQRAKGGQS